MSSSFTTRRFRAGPSFLLVGALMCALGFAPSAFASSTPTVNLGQASGYAVISGASVANTGNSTIRGDIGAPTVSGFPPGVLSGTTQVGSADSTAYNNFLTAYNEVGSRTGGTALPALAGATLTPGLYTASAAAGMAANTVVTLNGGPNAVFVIQVNGALTLGAGAQVKLTGGAQAANVFWQVTGAFSVGAAGTGPSQFVGTVMASTTADIGAGALVNGRVFAETAITTNDNEFYSAPPTMSLSGGGSMDVSTSSPTISGTTNVGTSGVVTVTVAGQTLTTTPALDGTWSVTPTILANGTYPVLALTTDGAANVGTANQQLTIDTVPPLIALNGAPTVLSTSATPVISGTTDIAPGTIITIDIQAQTLTAVVNGTTITESVGAQTLFAITQTNGTWNVSPGVPMGEGTRTVTASVTDLAGNTSTATEQLNVDTTTPDAAPPPNPATTNPATAAPTSAALPVTLPPASPTSTVTTPKPTAAPSAPTRVSLNSRTLTTQHPVKISYTLTKPGTVHLKLVQIVHGNAKAVGTATIKIRKAGKHSYMLTKRFAGHRLGNGSYELSLQTTIGKLHSKTVTQKISVR